MRDARTLREALYLPENLIYFDNAATMPRFRCAVTRMNRFYQEENANIHRSTYRLSGKATDAYETARQTVADFLGAAQNEIIITHGATESANLLANGICAQPGDNVVVSGMEHNANLLPWIKMCQVKGCELRNIPINADGSFNLESGLSQIDNHTRIVTVTAMSNVTGYKPDLRALEQKAHSHGAILIIDAAQAAAHSRINVGKMNCDYLFLSAHKIGGPMGIGVLYGKAELLKQLDPFILGGGTVDGMDGWTPVWKNIPERLESGTPDVAGMLGFEETLKCINRIGQEELFAQERRLAGHLRDELKGISRLHIIGTQENSPILSLFSEYYSAYDLGIILGLKGICTRSGKHCTHHFFKELKMEGVCRLSLSFYHTEDEIQKAAELLKQMHGGGRK